MPEELIPVGEKLADTYILSFPNEAAAAMEGMPTGEVAAILARQTDATTAAMLTRFRPDLAAEILALLPPPTRWQTLGVLEPQRSAALIARLDQETREAVLADVEPTVARDIEAAMSYPRDTAGSIMDTRVFVSTPEESVQEALERLRRLRDRRVYHIYIVDREGVYLGRVALQELAIADPKQPLESLITEPIVTVLATSSTAEVVETLEKYRLQALPVVSVDDHLLGTIRHQALVKAVEQEASIDIQTMVGASREERALSPVPFAVRKRLPWLQVNLLTAFLASFVVGLFETTIAQFTALAVLLPVVAGQSGNTGAQALAVTMRGLALREITTRHALRVAVKESLVGAINGVAVAMVTSVAVFVWSRSAGLAVVIGVAMVFSMLIAGLAGAVIPIFLTVAGQDPAQASSIVLTTVTDVVGFLSFLGLATLAAKTL